MEDHYYVVFRFDTDKRGEIIQYGQQLASMTDRFTERFSAQPANVFVGPHYVGSVLLVPSGYVYMQLPKRRVKTSTEDAKFSTGYEDKV
jgi:hypothetical protein